MSDLGNLKFRIKDEEQSIALQNVLFEMGCYWCYDVNDRVVQETSAQGLFVYTKGSITYVLNDASYFDDHPNTEQDTAEFIKQHTKTPIVTTPNLIPHKQAEFIRAFADGYEIEIKSTMTGRWLPFQPDEEMRIKPIPERVFPVTSLTEDELEGVFDNHPNDSEFSFTAIANATIKQYILDTEDK